MNEFVADKNSVYRKYLDNKTQLFSFCMRNEHQIERFVKDRRN